MKFYKNGKREYFVVNVGEARYSIRTVGRDFFLLFPGKSTPSEVFEPELKSKYFSEVIVENTVKGVLIVLRTKKDYVPVWEKKGNRLVVNPGKPVTTVETSKGTVPQVRIPVSVIAEPLFSSEAVFSFNKKSLSYPDNLFYMGVKYFNEGKYDVAVEFLKKIVEGYPESHFYLSSLFLLGDAYKALGEYNKAIKYYKMALEMSPKNSVAAETMFSMATIYRKEGDIFKEHRILQRIMEEFAGSVYADRARYIVGMEYYKDKRYNEAASMLSLITSSSPDFADARVVLTYIYYLLGQYQNALLVYSSVSADLGKVDANKRFKEFLGIMKMLCKLGQFNEADSLFDLLSHKVKESLIVQLYIERMKCDAREGKYEQMRKLAEYVVKHSKNKTYIEEAERYLIQCSLFEGKIKPEKLKAMLEKYRKNKEIMPLVLFAYARYMCKVNKYSEAMAYLKKLKDAYPGGVYQHEGVSLADKCLGDMLKNASTPEDYLLIYKFSTELEAYGFNLCRLARTLVLFGHFGEAYMLAPHMKSGWCKKFVIALYEAENGDVRDAERSVGGVSVSPENEVYVDFAKGVILYLGGKFDEALEILKKIETSDNELLKENALIYEALSYIGSGKFKSAYNVLGYNFRYFKNKVVFLRGFSLYNEGLYKAAIGEFEKLLRNKEYAEKSLFYMVMSYINLSDFDKAKHYYKELKERFPKSGFIKQLDILLSQ